MESKLSLVMTLKNRAILLERSLFALCRWQTFEPEQVELVLVDDCSDDREKLLEVIEEYRDFFYKVTLITMDKKLSKIPVFFNCPALGINLAVKAAENDAIYKTDPECLPLTETVRTALEVYNPEEAWIFSLRLLTEAETAHFSVENLQQKSPEQINQERLVQLPGLWHIRDVDGSRLHYWYGALFSKKLYMEIGGVDEEFLRGFAGEDDDWMERMIRAGVQRRWSDRFAILHQFHGGVNLTLRLCPEHQANIQRLLDGRAAAKVQANVDYDWGSESVVLERRVWEPVKEPVVTKPEPPKPLLPPKPKSPLAITKVGQGERVYWKAGNIPALMEEADVSVNMRVRDEVRTITQAVLSVLPVAREVLIADTGSTDGTLEILRALAARHKKIQLQEYDLPSMTGWGRMDDLSKLKRSKELTLLRILLANESKGKFIWIVDGDEVYPRETIAKVAGFIRWWPRQFVCGFLPLLWMRGHMERVTEARYPISEHTGRLFVRGKFEFNGAFPGESAHVLPDPPSVLITHRHPKAVVLDCPPYLHYEMMTKPHRRLALQSVDFLADGVGSAYC